MNNDRMMQLRKVVNDSFERCLNEDITPELAVSEAMDDIGETDEQLRDYMVKLVYGWFDVKRSFERKLPAYIYCRPDQYEDAMKVLRASLDNE